MVRLARAPLAILLGATLLGASGCAGSASPQTPADAVRESFRLVDAGDLEALVDLTCARQQETIRRQFSFTDVAGMVGADLDLTLLFRAIQLDASRLAITETSVSGDTASVLIAGPLLVSFDADQLRDTFRELAEQQGTEIQEAQLNALIVALQAASQTVTVNETVEVARENGTWRLCDRLTLIR
jgi:hypothetical protein